MRLLAFILLFAAMAVGLAMCKPIDPNAQQSEPASYSAAKRFAAMMGAKSPRFLCQPYDSDDDGYVSCTIFIQERDPVAIECPSFWSWNTECRMQKGALRR